MFTNLFKTLFLTNANEYSWGKFSLWYKLAEQFSLEGIRQMGRCKSFKKNVFISEWDQTEYLK